MGQKKWEGKVSKKLTKGIHADQIWPFIKDFFNLHKWLPGLGTCYGIYGNNGEPGCIRYCTDFNYWSDGDQNRPVGWAKERLLTVDEVQRSLSYDIVDGNIGLKSYVATVNVVQISDDDGQVGCVIEWSFVVDPIEGFLLDDLVKKYDVWVQQIAKNMGDAVGSNLLEV